MARWPKTSGTINSALTAHERPPEALAAAALLRRCSCCVATTADESVQARKQQRRDDGRHEARQEDQLGAQHVSQRQHRRRRVVEIQHVAEHQQEDRRQDDQHDGQHDVRRPLLVSPQMRLVIEEGDAQAVDGVVDHRRHQAELAQREERRLVGGDRLDVKLRPEDGPGGVDDVQHQEEHHPQPAQAVQRPTPLPDGAPVAQGLRDRDYQRRQGSSFPGAGGRGAV